MNYRYRQWPSSQRTNQMLWMILEVNLNVAYRYNVVGNNLKHHSRWDIEFVILSRDASFLGDAFS